MGRPTVRRTPEGKEPTHYGAEHGTEMKMRFTQPNATTVTFFDEDGYEFKLIVVDARDAQDARDRAHCAAGGKIKDGEWRPHGTMLIGGMDVEDTSQAPAPTASSRYAAEAAWRAEAASHVQGAISELEQAALGMPVSRERVLVDHALHLTAHAFRACTRNLELARRLLEAEPITSAQTTTGPQP